MYVDTFRNTFFAVFLFRKKCTIAGLLTSLSALMEAGLARFCKAAIKSFLEVISIWLTKY